MMMITEEKAEEWAKRIVYFNWSGDKSGSYSKFLKHWHGQERMYQDVISDNIGEEDLEKICSVIEKIISEMYAEPSNEISDYFKTRMKSVQSMGVFKYGNTAKSS
jgi:RNA processing factor Prp31